MLVWGEVDGVRAVWPKKPTPGPFVAELSFGVGHCDEVLAQSGVTHAVEHLAFEGFADRGFSWNGSTGPTTTSFVGAGTPTQVASLLAHVTSQLAEPPLARLETELRVLRTEMSSRPPGLVGFDCLLRFGALGPGVLGFEPFGLERLGPHEVDAWASKWFTKSNAVLACSKAPPSTLRLHLRGGPAPLRSPARQLPIVTHTQVRARRAGVAVTMLVPNDLRGARSGVAIARERLFSDLRDARGVIYDVHMDGTELTRGTGFVLLSTEPAEGESTTVATAIDRTLTDLATTGPLTRELRRDRDGIRKTWANPDAGMSWASTSASAVHAGIPVIDDEEIERRVDTLRPAVIVPAMQTILATALLHTPVETDPIPGWERYSDPIVPPVVGREAQPAEKREEGTIIIGSDGVTFRPPAGRGLDRTVRYQSAVLAQKWDNGDLGLTDADGTTVWVTDSSWVGGGGMTAAVEAGLRASGTTFVERTGGEARPPVVAFAPSAAPGATSDKKGDAKRAGTILTAIAAVVLLVLGVAGIATHETPLPAPETAQDRAANLAAFRDKFSNLDPRTTVHLVADEGVVGNESFDRTYATKAVVLGPVTGGFSFRLLTPDQAERGGDTSFNGSYNGSGGEDVRGVFLQGRTATGYRNASDGSNNATYSYAALPLGGTNIDLANDGPILSLLIGGKRCESGSIRNDALEMSGSAGSPEVSIGFTARCHDGPSLDARVRSLEDSYSPGGNLPLPTGLSTSTIASTALPLVHGELRWRACRAACDGAGQLAAVGALPTPVRLPDRPSTLGAGSSATISYLGRNLRFGPGPSFSASTSAGQLYVSLGDNTGAGTSSPSIRIYEPGPDQPANQQIGVSGNRTRQTMISIGGTSCEDPTTTVSDVQIRRVSGRQIPADQTGGISNPGIPTLVISAAKLTVNATCSAYDSAAGEYRNGALRAVVVVQF